MKTLLSLVATVLGLGLSLSVDAQQAESWPNRPVRLIVPAAPGGSPDTLARLLTARMQSTLKEAVREYRDVC